MIFPRSLEGLFKRKINPRGQKTNIEKQRMKLYIKKYIYQERGEDGKEGTKTENNRVANALVEHCLAVEEAALAHTLPTVRERVVLCREPQRWAWLR